MRGKPAAAAPFSGATVQLAGSSGYFICFLQLFGGEKQQKPSDPSRGRLPAALWAASGDCAVFRQTFPDAFRTRACGCFFAP